MQIVFLKHSVRVLFALTIECGFMKAMWRKGYINLENCQLRVKLKMKLISFKEKILRKQALLFFGVLKLQSV